MIMVRERLWSLEAESYLDGLRVAGEEGGVRVPQGEGIAVALPGFAPAVVVGCVYRPPGLSADATAELAGAMVQAAQLAVQKADGRCGPLHPSGWSLGVPGPRWR